jgi:hypothetical protein
MLDATVVAEGALGAAVTSATITARTPVGYDPFLAGRTVDRVTGDAVLSSGAAATWSAIVKRSSGPGLRAAERELAAYEYGIATARSEGALTAPRLLASTGRPGVVEVWLEDLRDEYDGAWPPERFALAARHIARWDTDIRGADRLGGFDYEDAWAERHGQPQRVPEVLAQLAVLRTRPDALPLMDLLQDSHFRRTEAMIASTAARIASLAALPQTLLHHDLVRSNLFAVHGSRTAAIDWENIGHAPAGVDLAPLVVGSVRRGEASAGDLARIEGLVLDAYEEVWTDHDRPASDVRVAYRLALGLRWHVVLGAITAWLDPAVRRIRGSRPAEPRAESLRQLVALARHLLDAAASHG